LGIPGEKEKKKGGTTADVVEDDIQEKTRDAGRRDSWEDNERGRAEVAASVSGSARVEGKATR
jgi:hypothetical protein